MNRVLILLIMLVGIGFLVAQPYAQSLFFSEYVEGASNNKAIEIFNGTGQTVDLSTVTVKLASNGGAWSTTNIITLTGTLAHGDVYVIANSQASAAILAVSDVTSTVTYFNGDDALGLFVSDVMVDIFGIYQNDPGTAWPVAGVADATLNHTLIRKPTVVSGVTDWAVAAGSNADDSQWIVQAQDYIDNLGMHTFTPGGGNQAATPVFNPGGGVYTQAVSVAITSSTAGAAIYYTTNGTTPTTSSTLYSAPVNVSATTTLKAIAVAAGMDPSYVATAVYTFPVVVPTVAALRSSPADGTTVYYLTSEVYLSFKQTFRNQKYFQDDTAGILVDDLAGLITTPLNVGDGVEGILGKISEYGGMLQFVPTANITSVTSTENPIIPIQITYGDLISNFDQYESRVVKVMNVSFSAPTGNFANGVVYETFDTDNDFQIRTTFYDVDYIGTPIPTIPMDIVGLPNSRTDGVFFTPRNLADIQLPAGGVAAPAFNPPSGLFFAPVSVAITTSTAGASIRYTTDGCTPTATSTLYSAPVSINSTTTLKAIAILGAESSSVNTAVYTFPVVVASLNNLADMPVGDTVYRISGEVNLIYQQSYRHQKFVQDPANNDSSWGVMIDDFGGVITSTYQIGDLIPNLTGKIAEFGGQKQFVPVADPGLPTGFQMPVRKQVSLEDLAAWMANAAQQNNLFSRLFATYPVRFQAATGNFATGQTYVLEDAVGNTISFRTSFYDADYIGSPVPTAWGVFTGIVNRYSGVNHFTSRSNADFVMYQAPITFTVQYTLQNSMVMNWTWPGEVPDYVTGLYIYRNGIPYQWIFEPQTLTYTDLNIVPGLTYEYQIYAQCNGSYLMPGPSQTVTATDAQDPSVPAVATALGTNYPNPFNPVTTINYSLKEQDLVTINIYNNRGQLVKSLISADMPAGNHKISWTGTDNSGSSVSSGIYYYRMQAGRYSSTRKMILMK